MARLFSPSLSLLLALAALGCSAEHRERPPPDCSIEERYDLLTAPTYNDASKYFSAPNPGLPDPKYASTTMSAATLDPAELCGHTSALVFKTQGNHDWGSLVGTWALPADLSPADTNASQYEGISFWARGLYDRSMTILLDDATSNADAGQCVRQNDDATHITFVDENGVPVPNACYLQFSIQLVPNPWWTFYTVPFKAFTQGGNTPDPRLKPDGIDRSTISRIVMRAPRDAFLENWFANIAWYRNAQ